MNKQQFEKLTEAAKSGDRAAIILKMAMVMHDNYCMAVGGKAFNGDDLPKSIDFFSDESKEKQSDAWLSTACAAVTFAECNSEIITDGLLREKADKWDAFKSEVDEFYLDENGEYSEDSPVRKGDLVEIGEVAACWTGWL